VTDALLRRHIANWKAFVALADSPDRRRSTPWLFRLQAYLIEFMVYDVSAVFVVLYEENRVEHYETGERKIKGRTCEGATW
jgi:hypothetical protein